MAKHLAISGGDLAGISPEITARACAAFPTEAFDLYTHEPLFRRACAQAGVALPANITFHPVAFEGDVDAVVPGAVDARVGDCAYRSCVAAAQAVLDERNVALVTAPFNKAALHLAGHCVPGHTELLAQLCQRQEATMAFFSPGLAMALATIHCAIAQVPALLTRERLERVCRDFAQALTRRLRRRPRIGVLALNPHAGEAGAFGDEESRVILPTMEACRDEADFIGPLVPDTAFTWMAQHAPAPVDGYIAMYHDQGLIPFKTYAFDAGVNTTLGLPLLRTSPDHGTAYDLAWQGRASATSMQAAIALALEMTRP